MGPNSVQWEDTQHRCISFSFSENCKNRATWSFRRAGEPVGLCTGTFSLLENWRKSSPSHCSQKSATGGRCWITYSMRVQPGSWPGCRNMLRVVWSVLRLHKERHPYFCFPPQHFGSSWVSFSRSHYCCFGDDVSWTMRCSCVLLSSWQTDKNFLRSTTGRRELVIFNNLFLTKR